MTITKDKTWEVTQVIVYGDDYINGDFQNLGLLFGIKEALISGTSEWIVKSSSNQTSAVTSAQTITGATQANPCQITIAGHGLSTGNKISIDSIVGMTELNNKNYVITVTGTDTFTLDGVDSTAYTAYTSGGSVYQDLWETEDDVIANTAAHSWIVLENKNLKPSGGGNGNLQICLDLDVSASASETMYFEVSPSGVFTGGTTSARPTATDGFLILSGTNWGQQGTSYGSKTAYVCKSTDGQCTRVYTSYGFLSYGFWIIDRLKNPVESDPATWSEPWVISIDAASDTPAYSRVIGTSMSFHCCPTFADPTANDIARGTTIVANITSPIRDSSFGYGQDYQGNWYGMPIGIDYDSATDNKKLGELYDFYLIADRIGQFTYLEDSGGAWQQICVGDGFAQPGDGTTEWWRG